VLIVEEQLQHSCGFTVSWYSVLIKGGHVKSSECTLNTFECSINLTNEYSNICFSAIYMHADNAIAIEIINSMHTKFKWIL